jgi:mRNA-degrading endonuclease RelE of RelBE toxin-antitoxin system
MTLSRSKAAMPEYGFHISAEIEKRMRRCRAPIRVAIRKRLDEIAISAATLAGKGGRRAKASARKGPALRFYVYEGYRIAYQLDPESRKVVVLDLELLPVD